MRMLPKVRTKSCSVGHLPLVRAVAENLGIMTVLDQHLPKHDQARVSDAECVLGMVLNILSGRVALYAMERWFAATDAELLIGEGCVAHSIRFHHAEPPVDILAESAGGAMHNRYDSSPTVTDCIFDRNTANGSGGAILSYDNCNLQVTNCLFINNVSGNRSGGLRDGRNCSSTLTNCTFTLNSAASAGGARVAGVDRPGRSRLAGGVDGVPRREGRRGVEEPEAAEIAPHHPEVLIAHEGHVPLDVDVAIRAAADR